MSVHKEVVTRLVVSFMVELNQPIEYLEAECLVDEIIECEFGHLGKVKEIDILSSNTTIVEVDDED